MKKLTYVYPVPDPETPGQVVDNRDGAYACDDCLPGVRALQIEQGLLVDLNEGRREMTRE